MPGGSVNYSKDGRWFHSRIMPYRTLDNRIDGVVLTFIDTTTSKLLEEQLRQTKDTLSARLADKTDELAQLRATLHSDLDQGKG